MERRKSRVHNDSRKMKYHPSSVARMKVVREAEMGVFLDAETGNTSDDILLQVSSKYLEQEYKLLGIKNNYLLSLWNSGRRLMFSCM